MSPIYVPGKVVLAKEFTWNESVWNPTMVGPFLWLDASDPATVTESSGSVSEWRDKSGNNRTFTQATGANQPAFTSNGLNGLSVLTFGGNDFLTNSGWQPYRSAAIVYSDSSTAGFVTPFGSEYIATGAYHGAASNAATFQSGVTDAKTLNGANFRNGSSIGNGTTTSRPSSVCVQTHVATGDLTQPFRNIGADFASAASRAITGIIAEVIISPFAWSSLDRQKLEGYLAYKWGLTASLPNDHPYKTVRPTP